MTTIPAVRLLEIIENAGYEPQSYSGRGMYGKVCVGVVSNGSQSLLPTIAHFVQECDDCTEASRLISTMVTDSMGLGTILYWPRTPWQKTNI